MGGRVCAEALGLKLKYYREEMNVAMAERKTTLQVGIQVAEVLLLNYYLDLMLHYVHF